MIHTAPALTRITAHVPVSGGIARIAAMTGRGENGGVRYRCIDSGCRACGGAGVMLATPRPFIALVRRAQASEFHVSFPDLPGCVSSGKTLAEAKQNAEGALALQCWHLHHAGRPVPSPSFMHEIMSRGPPSDALVMLIPPPSLAG
jgi:predicted RNase H-like HicB family nuclease